MGVATDMGLQNDFLLFSDRSATIDKVSDYVADFSDVSVKRHIIAIGKNESWEAIGMGLEVALKVLNYHTLMGIYS